MTYLSVFMTYPSTIRCFTGGASRTKTRSGRCLPKRQGEAEEEGGSVG